MNSNRRASRRMVMVLASALVIVFVGFLAMVWAAANDQQRPDYQGYNLGAPWFDGLPWDWFLDMFNQPSIKPQEVGTVQQFPVDSVPRSGAEPFIPPTAIVNGILLRDQMPKNPTQPTAESLARGQVLFETFCGVCHGNQGTGGTPVTLKGIPAPPIGAMFPFLTGPHLYNKIRYGGPIMPAYGFQTSIQDRWDMVNYMKSPQFGKGGPQ